MYTLALKTTLSVVIDGAIKGDAMLFSVDQLVGMSMGEYSLTQLLGQGHLSAVYAVQRQGDGQQAMLTIFLLPEDCLDSARERFMVRFLAQASVLSRLRHPYVVPTYAFGEQYGYPYLVTPLIDGETVASFLKRRGHCTPEFMLAFLRQIAESLDYAHRQGIVHGTLKSSNVLLVRQGDGDGLYTVMVAGFGLATILAMQGIGQVSHQYPSLFSVAGTLLINPAYIAPEVVLGGSFGPRGDVYALGILVFEMLCGHTPFAGSDPFEVIRQHVDGRIPSLQAVVPDVPAALDIALQRALERDPAHRLSTAGKLVSAFERVLDVMAEATKPVPKTPGVALPLNIHLTLLDTLPPSDTGKNVIAMPGITSSHVTSVSSSFPGTTQFKLQSMPKPAAISLGPIPRDTSPSVAAVTKEPTVDEHWWTRDLPPEQTVTPVLADEPEKLVPVGKKRPFGPQPDQGRRRIVTAVNGIITVGVLAGGGFSLFRLLQDGIFSFPGQKATTNSVATPQNSSSQTQKPVRPTGNVISTHAPSKNAAQTFTHPSNHREDILIQLPSSLLVAYERTCTHEGVLVNYDAKSQTLVCPRHQAQFDPARQGAVVRGPALKPLKKVTIHVQVDGTITTDN